MRQTAHMHRHTFHASHHATSNGSRPSTKSVETSKKSAIRDTSRNVKFERPWNLSLMACSETPSSCARSRCVT
nr:MAG TPA: hypothetical protein [Caudoviricetes sp.]